jgi:Tol biopolymer transport system component
MQQLTNDPAPDWGPRWSPDGKEVAFYAYRTGNREIWVQPLGGGPARQVTESEAGAAYPEWSPDGREIACHLARNIWVIAAGGGEARQVTFDPAGDFAPGWSPDGEWLAFASLRTGRQVVWRVASKGGEPQKLSEGEGDTPRWSPDGKWIYFPGRHTRSLWALPATGGRTRQAADLGGSRGRLNTDTLATDGKYLYFSWKDGLGDIWVMDVVYE